MGGHRASTRVTACLISGLAAIRCHAAIRGGGSIALTGDDVFHGISWTCGEPAAQADLHLLTDLAGASSVFAGVWGSAGLGSSPCGATRELDPYAGYSKALSPDWSVSLRYTHYGFPGGTDLKLYRAGARYDYDEIDTSLAFQDQFFLTAAWTPDAIRYAGSRYAGYEKAITRNRRAYAFGLEWLQPLGRWLGLSVGAGYDTVLDPTGRGWNYWSAGLSHTAGPWQLSVSYFRSAGKAARLFGAQAAGARVAVSLLWRF